MAIKGKGKTKSRPPARAPRPVPVVRKPPFFARRWVQLVGALLVGAIAVVVVVWATNGLRSSDAAEARAAEDANARRAIQEWQATVEGTLSKVGTPGAGPGQFVVLPTLAATVDTLAKGDADREAQETAAAAVPQIDEAATTLDGVDLPTLIRDKGLDTTTANYVLNSKARMLAGLRLFGRVAAMITAATADDADPAVADALIAEAKELLPLATTGFDEGYSDYTSALASVGLLQPTPGIPGAEGIPGAPAIPGAPSLPGSGGGAPST